MAFYFFVLLFSISISVLLYYTFLYLNKKYKEFRLRFIGKTSKDLDYLYSEMQAERVFIITIMSMISFGVVGLIFNLPSLLTIILIFLGYFPPKSLISYLRKKRMKKFDEQLVEGITMVANSLKIGFNLHQSLKMLVDEMPSPISQEFGLVLKENQLGATLETALENLCKRMKSMDLELAVAAINLSQRTGGDLGEIFKKIAFTIRDRNQIKRKVEALTSLGKIQTALVGLLPFVLLAFFYFQYPTIIYQFFNDPAGLKIIICVFGLLILGILMIRKIAKVEF